MGAWAPLDKRFIMYTKIVNCTPHALNVHTTFGTVTTVPTSGIVARVSVMDTELEEIVTPTGEHIALFTQTTGEVEGLPAPQDDTLYIVSGMVRGACPDREDVASPGKLLRNDKGQPIGCLGLYVN